MNPREKRSSGGYGLRRKIAKKRLDEDFEYYFSKIGTSPEIKSEKFEEEEEEEEEYDEDYREEVIMTDIVRPNNKIITKCGESPEKRPRGRPRKGQVTVPKEPDISETNLKFVDLKEKRCRKTKVVYLEQSETNCALEAICRKEDDIVNVSHEEVVEDDSSVEKHLKLDSVLTEEITGLREEEVTSLPEGEKENLPEEGVSLDSFTEDRIVLPMSVEVQCDSGEGEIELYDGEETVKGYTLIQKAKRKYRRNRLSQDTIRKLSQLNPDEKVECSECHKLLKPSSFRQHLRTHTGEKPFGCEVCDARFTRKGDVERHVRIVHNKQKPFKCCRCQRAFGDKKNLRWHLMNHDKKLFYVCGVCGFKFGKREYWENHVRFIHPLPGGMDPGDADGDEERLQALTDSLLEDDDVDEPSQDDDACIGEHNAELENFIASEVPNDVPLKYKVIHKELKTIPLKTFSNLVKATRPKDGVTEESSSIEVSGEPVEGETVVIQINESSAGTAEKSILPTKISKQQMYNIRVVSPKNMMQLVQDESVTNEPIIIDTRYDSEEPTDISPDPVMEVSVDNENSSNGAEYSQQEAPKIISIMLDDEGGATSDGNNGNVQTLIEALLNAARGGSKGAQNT